MANTDRISTITSTELVHNEVDDRATMSQRSSLRQVIRFVSRPLMPICEMRDRGPFVSSVAGVDEAVPIQSINLIEIDVATLESSLK